MSDVALADSDEFKCESCEAINDVEDSVKVNDALICTTCFHKGFTLERRPRAVMVTAFVLYEDEQELVDGLIHFLEYDPWSRGCEISRRDATPAEIEERELEVDDAA